MRWSRNVSPMHVINTRFLNGEISVRFPGDVANKDIILLKRFSSNLHEDIFELLQCVDTLRRMGAQTITLLLPYYPYARQDHGACCESQGGLLFAKLFANIGVKKIITIDMHAPEQLRDFPLKVVNLTTERFWEKYLKSLDLNNNEIQIVAADKSATTRAQQIASVLDCSWGYANKQREANGEVQITEVVGFCPEKRTFLVDDLIDTGRTMVATTQALRTLSAQPIVACATHCHLSEALFNNLISIGISQLITTDTIKRGVSAQVSEGNLTVLDISSMLFENDVFAL